MDELLERLVTAAERAVEVLEEMNVTLQEIAVDVANTERRLDEIGSKLLGSPLPWLES